MVPVSFAGALGHSTVTLGSPDKWYLRVSSDHPSRTLCGVVHVLSVSASRTACTVTIDHIPFECNCSSVGHSLSYLIKQTLARLKMLALRLGDTSLVGFSRVRPSGEHRERPHGGPRHGYTALPCCFATRTALYYARFAKFELPHFASSTERPPGKYTRVADLLFLFGSETVSFAVFCALRCYCFRTEFRPLPKCSGGQSRMGRPAEAATGACARAPNRLCPIAIGALVLPLNECTAAVAICRMRFDALLSNLHHADAYANATEQFAIACIVTNALEAYRYANMVIVFCMQTGGDWNVAACHGECSTAPGIWVVILPSNWFYLKSLLLVEMVATIAPGYIARPRRVHESLLSAFSSVICNIHFHLHHLHHHHDAQSLANGCFGLFSIADMLAMRYGMFDASLNHAINISVQLVSGTFAEAHAIWQQLHHAMCPCLVALQIVSHTNTSVASLVHDAAVALATGDACISSPYPYASRAIASQALQLSAAAATVSATAITIRSVTDGATIDFEQQWVVDMFCFDETSIMSSLSSMHTSDHAMTMLFLRMLARGEIREMSRDDLTTDRLPCITARGGHDLALVQLFVALVQLFEHDLAIEQLFECPCARERLCTYAMLVQCSREMLWYDVVQLSERCERLCTYAMLAEYSHGMLWCDIHTPGAARLISLFIAAISAYCLLDSDLTDSSQHLIRSQELSSRLVVLMLRASLCTLSQPPASPQFSTNMLTYEGSPLASLDEAQALHAVCIDEGTGHWDAVVIYFCPVTATYRPALMRVAREADAGEMACIIAMLRASVDCKSLLGSASECDEATCSDVSGMICVASDCLSVSHKPSFTTLQESPLDGLFGVHTADMVSRFTPTCYKQAEHDEYWTRAMITEAGLYLQLSCAHAATVATCMSMDERSAVDLCCISTVHSASRALRTRGGAGNTSAERIGNASTETVPFLIDGASSFTLVNDISLLEPGSVQTTTCSHSTARAGCAIEPSASGTLTRLWQQRDGSWEIFSISALYCAEVDENVLAEHSLFNELRLIPDKFEKQALIPAVQTNPGMEIPLVACGNVFYVHTINVPVMVEISNVPRANFCLNMPTLADMAPAPSPIHVVETSESVDNGQKRMCAGFGRVPGGEHTHLDTAEHAAADDNRDRDRCTSKSRLSHSSNDDLPKYVCRTSPTATNALPFRASYGVPFVSTVPRGSGRRKTVTVGYYADPTQASRDAVAFKLAIKRQIESHGLLTADNVSSISLSILHAIKRGIDAKETVSSAAQHTLCRFNSFASRGRGFRGGGRGGRGARGGGAHAHAHAQTSDRPRLCNDAGALLVAEDDAMNVYDGQPDPDDALCNASALADELFPSTDREPVAITGPALHEPRSSRAGGKSMISSTVINSLKVTQSSKVKPSGIPLSEWRAHAVVDMSQSVEQVINSIKQSLIKRGVSSSAAIRILEFNAGDQKPCSRIGRRGAIGHSHRSDYLVNESMAIKSLLCDSLGHRNDMWSWITAMPDIKVTSIFAGDNVCAASLGVNDLRESLYFMFMTAVKCNLRSLGLGTLIRRLQTTSAGSAQFLSLTDERIANDQVKMMAHCGYSLSRSEALARELTMKLNGSYPTLSLSKMLNTENVVPLLFTRDATLAAADDAMLTMGSSAARNSVNELDSSRSILERDLSDVSACDQHALLDALSDSELVSMVGQ